MVAARSDEDAVWGLDGNVLSVSAYARGDVEEALARSAHVVDQVFQTQRIEHAFLEPESTLAVPTDDGLHVYSGGQGVWDDRDQIARVLGIDPERITVELVSNGGAFGGKEDLSNQAQTALAAWLTGRPVRCTLSREESLLLHSKRHPIRMAYRAGCAADGRLTALWARGRGGSGPGSSPARPGPERPRRGHGRVRPVAEGVERGDDTVLEEVGHGLRLGAPSRCPVVLGDGRGWWPDVRLLGVCLYAWY